MTIEIIIGDGQKLASAHIVRDLSSTLYVSQNLSAFWITDSEFDVDIKVYKTCVEGIRLKRLIDIDADTDTIIEFIHGECIFKYLDIVDIYILINNIKKSATQAGMDMKLAEIRSALGL